MNVVLFCGGRGSTALIKEMVRWPGISLTLLVNAYDDGLSTGAIRRAIPGFLGPSDFRKNLVSTLLQSGEQHLEVATLMEHRLKLIDESVISFADLLSKDSEFRRVWMLFRDSRKIELENYVKKFISYLVESSIPFDFQDCAIGNLVYAGAYLEYDKNFQAANSRICNLIGINATIVSVSNEETHLVGLVEDGTVLRDESSIVNLNSNHEILEIFLLPSAISDLDISILQTLDLSGKSEYLKNKSKIPDATTEAYSALESADLIVYGSGTQHSSLLPSYMVLTKNGIVPKDTVPRVLITNLEWDYDIQGWSIEELLSKFNKSWGIEKTYEHVSHILVDDKSPFRKTISESQNLDGINVTLGNFRNATNPAIHSGFAVYKEIQNIIQFYRKQNSSGIHFTVSLDSKQFLRKKILEAEIGELHWPEKIEVNFKFSTNPEEQLIAEYENWLESSSTRYFIGCTGHGQYAIGDVLIAIDDMPETMSALNIGNRFRTRNEWILAKKTVFEEKRLNQIIATVGSIVVNILVAGKFKKSVADPFSRIFIIDRLSLPNEFNIRPLKNKKSVLGLYSHFWKSNLVTSEFQVKFRATYGESKDRKLIRQGLHETWKLLWL